MKRIIVMLLLISLGINTYAKKSYLFVYCWAGTVYLSGDIPPSIKMQYTAEDFKDKIDSKYYNTYHYWFGYIINILADEGYVLEQMYTGGDNFGFNLFAKQVEGSSDADAIQKVKASDESEAYEVARYNLQGLPVHENEKGVQIVVYSNYTTKTVIVQ